MKENQARGRFRGIAFPWAKEEGGRDVGDGGRWGGRAILKSCDSWRQKNGWLSSTSGKK